MVHSPYRYQLELFTLDGHTLGRAALNVDWEPAREWTRFAAVRAGRVPPAALDTRAIVEPVWHAKTGEPYVDGVRVSLTVEDDELTYTFGTAYFARSAKAALEAISGRKGEKKPAGIRYVTTAYRETEAPPEPPRPVFAAREIAPSLHVEDGSIEELAARTVRREGEERAGNNGDMPVFLPQRVLEEAAALTATAGARETGGILIGHLRQDRRGPGLFAEVTAQVPARHTEADLTTLTFTADTWTDVRNAIALRGRRELMLGWWHSHPVRQWCKDCPPERQRTCSLGAGFLSAHDRALHRTVFPRAYSLALVVNDVAGDGPTFSLFGWREGVLEPRGFAGTRE